MSLDQKTWTPQKWDWAPYMSPSSSFYQRTWAPFLLTFYITHPFFLTWSEDIPLPSSFIHGAWNSSEVWLDGATTLGSQSLSESVEPTGGWREVGLDINEVPTSPSSNSCNADGFGEVCHVRKNITVRRVCIIGHNLRVAHLPQFH